MDPRGPLPDLESLRCFVEAARALNFRAAAKVVGLTPAALGQRIRQLEDRFGVKLFNRTTRSVEITEAGMALLPVAQETLETAWECVRAARGELGPPPMEIRLGTRHELGLSWLTPLMPKLGDPFPSVTFHLYFGSGSDLELRVLGKEVDCAISSRRITDPRIDAVRIHREDYVLVAHPDLIAEAPLLTAEDAEAHTLVDIGPELPLFRYWRDAPGNELGLSFGRLRFMGTIAAIRSAVVDKMGVAVLPEYLVRGDLESGRLVRLFDDVEPIADWFRLFFRSGDPRTSLFRSLADVMAREPLR